MNPATRVVDRPGVSTEADAIAVLRNGDGQGFETLVRLHQLRATKTAFGITWQREAAQHAAAETSQRRRLLLAAVAELEPRDRAVIILRYYGSRRPGRGRRARLASQY